MVQRPFQRDGRNAPRRLREEIAVRKRDHVQRALQPVLDLQQARSVAGDGIEEIFQHFSMVDVGCPDALEPRLRSLIEALAVGLKDARTCRQT